MASGDLFEEPIDLVESDDDAYIAIFPTPTAVSAETDPTILEDTTSGRSRLPGEEDTIEEESADDASVQEDPGIDGVLQASKCGPIPQELLPRFAVLCVRSQKNFGRVVLDEMRDQADDSLKPFMRGVTRKGKPRSHWDAIARDNREFFKTLLHKEGYRPKGFKNKAASEMAKAEKNDEHEVEPPARKKQKVIDANHDEDRCLEELASLWAKSKSSRKKVSMPFIESNASLQLMRYLNRKHNTLDRARKEVWCAIPIERREDYWKMLEAAGFPPRKKHQRAKANTVSEKMPSSMDIASCGANVDSRVSPIARGSDGYAGSLARIEREIHSASALCSAVEIELACLRVMSRFDNPTEKTYADWEWIEGHASADLVSAFKQAKDKYVLCNLKGPSRKAAFEKLSNILKDEYHSGFRFSKVSDCMDIIARIRLHSEASTHPALASLEFPPSRQVHNVGDTVYALPTQDEEEKDEWLHGEIVSWKVVLDTGTYGESRTYHIRFEDGTENEAIRDYFVRTVEDYIWWRRNRPLLGVDHVLIRHEDITDDDKYPCRRGWYVVGETIYSSFCEALRAADDSIVAQRKRRTMESDLNLPHEWDFDTMDGCPSRKDMLGRKTAPKPISTAPLLGAFESIPPRRGAARPSVAAVDYDENCKASRPVIVSPRARPAQLRIEDKDAPGGLFARITPPRPRDARMHPSRTGRPGTDASWQDFRVVLHGSLTRFEEKCQGFGNLSLKDLQDQSRGDRILVRHSAFLVEEKVWSEYILKEASRLLGVERLKEVQMYEDLRMGRFEVEMHQLRSTLENVMSLNITEYFKFFENQEKRWKKFHDAEKTIFLTFFDQ